VLIAVHSSMALCMSGRELLSEQSDGLCGLMLFQLHVSAVVVGDEMIPWSMVANTA